MLLIYLNFKNIIKFEYSFVQNTNQKNKIKLLHTSTLSMILLLCKNVCVCVFTVYLCCMKNQTKNAQPAVKYQSQHRHTKKKREMERERNTQANYETYSCIITVAVVVMPIRLS